MYFLTKNLSKGARGREAEPFRAEAAVGCAAKVVGALQRPRGAVLEHRILPEGVLEEPEAVASALPHGAPRQRSQRLGVAQVPAALEQQCVEPQ